MHFMIFTPYRLNLALIRCLTVWLTSVVICQSVWAADTSIGEHRSGGRNLLPNSYDTLGRLNYLPENIVIDDSTGNIRDGDRFQNPSLDAIEAAEAGNSVSDVWGRIRQGYQIPNVEYSATVNYENLYTAKPDYLTRMFDRSRKYLYHVVSEVEKRGMPSEIALLPMVESAYNPQALSRSKASGLWQFIPTTGKVFGLKQNWWVDKRRGVTEATDAALTYLQKLHVMFGAWDLALAAYNAGEGTVARAIERNRRLGLPTDYQNLDLPEETKNYVPKLQALKNIMSNPERFGVNVNPIANQPYFTKVQAPAQIDLQLAAKLAEITPEEFSALNPQYNRPVLISGENAHEFLLPIAAAQRFKTNLSNYDKPLSTWQTYNAQRGEPIETIASKFGMSTYQLRSANGLDDSDKLNANRPLLVASSGNNNEKIDANAMQSALNEASTRETRQKEEPTTSNKIEPERTKPEPVRYTVKKGDTLNSIARAQDIDLATLAVLNGFSKQAKLQLGQEIIIAQKDLADKKSKEPAAKQPALKENDKTDKHSQTKKDKDKKSSDNASKSAKEQSTKADQKSAKSTATSKKTEHAKKK